MDTLGQMDLLLISRYITLWEVKLGEDIAISRIVSVTSGR